MTVDATQPIFANHRKLTQFTYAANTATMAFKEHPQFQHLVDILSRKEHHHVMLRANFSPLLFSHFVSALAQYLTHEHIPHYLRTAEFIYTDTDQTNVTTHAVNSTHYQLFFFTHLTPAVSKKNYRTSCCPQYSIHRARQHASVTK